MKYLIFLLFLWSLMSCKDPDPGKVDITSTIQANFKSAVKITIRENKIILKSDGLPSHKTPYWGKGHELYEDFPNGHQANENASMSPKNYTMTIPARPNQALSPEETSLGPIGMALDGVAIFNDREGRNLPLDALTMTTFDRIGAHPGPGEDYHYHVTTLDDSNLIGFLRDGYPIYGRQEMDGSYPTDLDENGGHFGITADFPEGIYHYHASNVNYLNTGFYILKEGSYYGTKGTFTH